MTDDIVEFIKEQLDLDAELARDAGATRSGEIASWRVECECFGQDDDDHVDGCIARRVVGDNITIYDEGGHDEDQAQHIARHDPAAVLADVAGKRAILAEVLSWQHAYIDGDSWLSCAQAVNPHDGDGTPGSGCADEQRAGGPCDCGLDRRRAMMLNALAAGYVGRPGFKPEWRLS